MNTANQNTKTFSRHDSALVCYLLVGIIMGCIYISILQFVLISEKNDKYRNSFALPLF